MSSSTAAANRQLRTALTLLNQRQQQQDGNHDPDLETSFYNAVLEYLLLSTTDHWWCTSQTLTLARESLWLFSLPDHDQITAYKIKLDGLLQRCPQCIKAYYTTKNDMRQR